MTSDKQIILITGGNAGLGLEAVRALAKTSTPYEIIVGCRTRSKGEDAIKQLQSEFQTSSTLSTLQIDLESDDSIEKAVQEITSKHGQLDVLINNGGASFDPQIASGNMSIRDAFNKSWDVNVSGTHVLTHHAVPLLLKAPNPRLMFVTSGTSSMHETIAPDMPPPVKRINASPEAGWPKLAGLNPITTYRSSKTGLNMLMREWARLLKNDGVKVWAISPGFLATGLGGIGQDKLRQMGALEPHIGGEFIRDVVQGKRDEDVGKIVRNDGVVQPW
ncbi:hypothetical protein LTR70_008599 [Exophiala xenobiotica]|nr:hypothetical protein LTR70_008599 [Exophiala xenobiotica]